MDPEAFLSPEVGLAVGLSMLVSNAKVRRAARGVLVRGLAAAMEATAAVKTLAAGVHPASAAGAAMQDLKADAQALHSAPAEAQAVRHSTRRSQHADQV